MRHSLGSTFGELMVDHRASPGIPELGRTGLMEMATITCTHCGVAVIMRKDRERNRHYCRACDHYICDHCATIMTVSMEHKTYNQLADEIREKYIHSDTPILLKG